MEILCTSPWVPPEWIKAHGLEPRGAWLHNCAQLTGAPEGVCAFAQAIASLAEAHPEAAVVFTTACDQMRRTADAVASRAGSRCFLFNLPATWQTSVAQRIFSDELRRLGRFLISLGGHATSTKELIDVMARYSHARRQLLEAVRWCPARRHAEAVAQFHLDGSVNLPPQPGPERERSVPVAVVGGPLLHSQTLLLDAIEKVGGRVVLNATEVGERSLWAVPPPDESGGDPVEQLARAYLANCVDVFQRPNTRLYDWLRARLTARRARGIVLWHHVGCDLWRAEAQSLRDAFGLPLLLLEADGMVQGRNTGRVEAFLESLR